MQLVESAKSVASAKKATDYTTVPDGTAKSEYAVLLERECGHEKLILRDMARTLFPTILKECQECVNFARHFFQTTPKCQ